MAADELSTMYDEKTENQMNTSLTRARNSSLSILALALVHPSCTGTEADNPFTDPTTTSLCKGADDYKPLANLREPLTVDPSWSAGPSRAELPAPESTLLPLGDIPIWLECLEWDLAHGVFDYQVANFRGGCEVSWSGGGRVTDQGDVLLELHNNNCAVAACGNCLYDVRSGGQLEMPQVTRDVTFELIRKNCDGEVTVESEWILPTSEQTHGLHCRKADAWGAEAGGEGDAFAALYAPCGDAFGETRSCPDGLSCVAESCVPSCSADEDCPLSGALTCQDNYCQLAE